MVSRTPDRATVGWIGTGLMGASMCRHLVDRGYRATVTTRTRAKAAGLVEAGATWADPSYAPDGRANRAVHVGSGRWSAGHPTTPRWGGSARD